MGTERACKASEAARELGIPAERPRQGEKRGLPPLARRDINGHRYHTREGMERLGGQRSDRRTSRTLVLRVPGERREAEPELAGYLISWTGKLALEEQAAVAKGDWVTAKSKAE